MEAAEVESRGGRARLRKASVAAMRCVMAWLAASIDSWKGATVVPAGAVDRVGGRACCGSLRKNVTESAAELWRQWLIRCGVRMEETLR